MMIDVHLKQSNDASVSTETDPKSEMPREMKIRPIGLALLRTRLRRPVIENTGAREPGHPHTVRLTPLKFRVRLAGCFSYNV